MPRNFHRRDLLTTPAYIDYLNTFAGVDWWHMQEQSGAVALATNSALALGRRLNLLTYGDYVAGANWANSSGEIARHSAGSVETFQQDDILAPGKTYQVTITLANRTAGSVTITDGGAAISTNEQTTRTITSTGTDFIITPTTDFDGDIDVELILVQQTNIAASSVYVPGTNPMDGSSTAAAVGQVADGNLGYGYAFDGATSFVNIYSAELNSKLSFDLGSIIIFGRVRVLGVWEDTIQRALIDIRTTTGDSLLIIRKSSTNNKIDTFQKAGGVQIGVPITSFAPAGYFMIVTTWDNSGGGEFKVYANAAQRGVTQTTLGTQGENIKSTEAIIGSFQTTPTQVWDGDIAHVGIANRALSPIEIADIWQRNGLA